jgi:hypothetical protein
VASVIDDARTLDPGPFLDGREAAIRHAAPEQMTFVRDHTRIGGREAAVLRANGTRGAQTIVAVFAAVEGTRAISCIGESERCLSVVEALAAAPWARPAPGARPRSTGELRFGESSPVVPPGCRAMPVAFDARTGMIACPGGHQVGWVAASDETTVSSARDALVSRILSSKQWGGDPEDLPCRIAGMIASCTRLTAPAARGREVAMWGTATVDETRWFAFCTAGGEEPVPSPCSSVFSLR